jgi:hypothetical protein
MLLRPRYLLEATRPRLPYGNSGNASIGRNLMLNSRTFQNLKLVDPAVLNLGIPPSRQALRRLRSRATSASRSHSGRSCICRIRCDSARPGTLPTTMPTTLGDHLITEKCTHDFLVDSNFTWSRAMDYAVPIS